MNATFGRATAERDLSDLLASARRSRAAVLRVVGEPGFGKTLLCHEAIARAGEDNFLTVSCAGMQWESEFTMATASQLLRPLLQVSDDRPSEARAVVRDVIDGRPSAVADPYGVSAAALSVVAAAADCRPVLLIVDDAHWVDRASAALITFVTRRLYADAVAILLAERAGVASYFPRDLPTHVLTPLSAGDIRELLTHEQPDLPPAPSGVCETLRVRSGGNPLALRELAPRLTASQLAGSEPIPDPLPLGERGKVSFGAQIAELPARTREALGVVAATGSQAVLVQPALVSLGLNVGDLDRAVEAGMVTPAPAVQFTHPLRRSAAYQALPEATRRHIHLTLADLNENVDVERHAHHLDLGGAAPHVIAAAAERAAASIAARAGDGAAARAWARSAHLTAEPSARRRRALHAAVGFLAAGDGDACRKWIVEVLGQTSAAPATVQDRDQGEVTAEAMLVKCEAAVWHSTADADLPGLTADAERLAHLDRRRAVIAFGLLAAAYENRGKLAESVTVTKRSLELADQLADRDRFIATTWAAHAFTLARGCAHATPVSALVSRDAAEALAEASPMTLWTIAQTAEWQEDLAFAMQISQLAIAALRSRSLLSWLPYALSVDAEVHWRAGLWAHARASAAEAVELADTAGQSGLIGFTLSIAGLTAGLTGAGPDCERYLRRALQVATQTGLTPVELYARHSYGAYELARGQGQLAAAHLDRAHKLAVAVEMGQPSVVPYHADRVEALLRTGRLVDAADMCQYLRSAAERSGSRWAAAAELRCRAQLLSDAPDCEGWLRESIAVFDTQLRQPYERCRSELELGAMLRRKRRLAEARQVLADAAAGFRELGAVHWAERCDLERRAAGDRAPGAPAAASPALAQLTAQQLQVVLKVSAGATNREAAAALFLSPKTVDYHLRRACAVLGVRTRVELARLVAMLPRPDNLAAR